MTKVICNILKIFCIIQSLIWFTGSTAQAQDSLNVFRTQFTRQNNFTTRTTQDLSLRKQVGKIKYQVYQNQELLYNQNLETRKLVQGNASSAIWIRRSSGKRIEPLIFLESDIFLNSRNGRSQWYGGMAIHPLSGMEITPLYGYNIDVRNGRTDHGVTPAVFLKWQEQSRPDFSLQILGFSRVKYIAPRRQDNHRLEILTEKRVGELARIWFSSAATFHELDDYQSRSVQRLLSDTLSLNGGFYYQLSQGLAAEASQRFTRQHRNYRYKSLHQEAPEFNAAGFRQDEVQSQLRLIFRRDKLETWVSYEYFLLNRNYRLGNELNLPAAQYASLLRQESEKNYRSVFQKWGVFFRYMPGRKHILEAEYSSQYLKYDTPLSTNMDDRDEITYITRLNWTWQVHKKLRLLYEVTGQSRYSGFLSGTRSRDNYHQYNLKFRTQVEWKFHPRWMFRAEQAVYVTYNVKTFGDPQLTDRSTRFLENKAELNSQWHRKWNSLISAERKNQKLSYLNWQNFAESPLDTTWFITLEQKNEFTWGGKKQGKTWSVSAGYRYFLLLRHMIAQVQMPDTDTDKIRLQMYNLQSGPLTELSVRTYRGNRLSLKLWWQTQQVYNKSSAVDQELYSSQNISFDELRLRQKIFRPYFDLAMMFFF